MCQAWAYVHSQRVSRWPALAEASLADSFDVVLSIEIHHGDSN
jgi:hypothetical protein